MDRSADITLLLERIERGESLAAAELFPIVYDELRRLASWKLAGEKAGHTLQPTALVNEAYVRLVGERSEVRYESRRGFFVAASEAMRHILVDSARRKLAQKRGGDPSRVEVEIDLLCAVQPSELLEVHEALEALSSKDPQCADLVKLHYFGGYSLAEVAELLGISRSTANRWWIYSKAFLAAQL